MTDTHQTRIPQRVQMSRQKPWRPGHPDAVIVARPTKYGNPFAYHDRSHGLVHEGPEHLARFGRAWDYEGRISNPGQDHPIGFNADNVVESHTRWATRAEIVELYRLTLVAPTPGMIMAYPPNGGHLAKVGVEEVHANLSGRDLACWCPVWDAAERCSRCGGSGRLTYPPPMSRPGREIAVCGRCEGTGFARNPCHADVLLILANPEVHFPWAVNYR